jgi:hypothetical protein
MNFKDVLAKCVGQTVVINNDQERTLVSVEEDFIVLSGGNTQMKITDFVPLLQISKVIKMDYATGGSAVSIDLLVSGGDQKRGGGGSHF